MGEEELSESIVLMAQQYFFFPFIILLVVASLWFIAGILLCLWVYEDAKSRGMEGALWVLIVLVANVVGLIVYLIVREENRPRPQISTQSGRQTRFCANCGSELALNAKFCSNCGKSVT
jgi:hypothetical protein